MRVCLINPRLINRAKVMLDIQQPHAPLAHRMFEAMMCGTPVITRRRSEVDRIFGDWDGILTYDTTEELIEQARTVIDDPNWVQRSATVRDYCLKHHDIKNRLADLLPWVEAL